MSNELDIDTIKRALRTPLNLLHYEQNDIAEAGKLNQHQKDYLEKTYEPGILSIIYKSLEWASNNPTFDYQPLMNLDPMPTNKELHAYLIDFYQSMTL